MADGIGALPTSGLVYKPRRPPDDRCLRLAPTITYDTGPVSVARAVAAFATSEPARCWLDVETAQHLTLRGISRHARQSIGGG